MALYLVLSDYQDRSVAYSAATVLDSEQVAIAPLQAGGLAVTPYDPNTMGTWRTAFISQRGTPHGEKADFVALLLAAGVLPAGVLPTLPYTPSTSADWDGDPASVGAALDRIAAALATEIGTPIP